MENARLILYLSLALVVFLIWERWQVWQMEQHAPPPVESHSVATEATSSADDLPDIVASGMSPARTIPQQNRYTKSERIQVKTDLLDVSISTKGGDMTRADLLDQPVSIDQPEQPFRLLDEGVYVVQSGLLHDQIAGLSAQTIKQRAPSHHSVYSAQQSQAVLQDGQEQVRVALSWQNPNGIVVDKIYTFRRASYVVDIEHWVLNRSSENWVGRQYRQIRRSQDDAGGMRLLYTFTGAAYYDGKYNKLSFDEIASKQLSETVRGGWVAMLQHYFVTAFLALPNHNDDFYTRMTQSEVKPEYIIGMRSEPIVIAPGSRGQFTTRLYLGPKLQKQLEAVQEGLELTTDYGIFSILSKPLFWLLNLIYEMVGNWGVAIILLTVLIKLIFYKLSETSYRSMARMRKLQPSLMALRDRFKEDRARMQKEMMAFYRREKINPLGGCLPILVQIPVFIALYWVLLESVELRQAPFFFWVHDLSTRDPYFVLPLLMGATMLVQMKLNPTPPDPIQAKVMMMLPIIFTVFFAFFPSGLVLYWLVNNLLSIAQQYAINKRIEQE